MEAAIVKAACAIGAGIAMGFGRDAFSADRSGEDLQHVRLGGADG